MKKVLFVASVVKLHIMAFHIPYLKWFKENGYELHVAARNDYENKADCKIPFCDQFHDLPFERSPLKKNNLYVQIELRKIIESNEYKIIHCHTPIGGALGRIAARRARKKGTKVIYTAHGFHFLKGAPVKNWLIYYPIEKWLSRYTDVLITINKEDYHRAKKSFKAGAVEYIPGVGVDINKFANVTVDKIAKRKELNLSEDAFVVLSVGELNKNKNHEVIIKAIAKLNNPNIYYIICGQGPLEHYLKDLADKLDIGDRVRLLGYRRDIPEILKAADVFAFPSLREGLPVSLMEAMASGLPCAASRIRGNIDLLRQQNEELFNPINENEVASCILKMLNNKNKSKQMTKNIEVYSIENVLCIMRNIYEIYN